MSRRSPGEGSIYRRKDGRFEGAIQYLDESGKRRRPRVYGRTRQEASRKLDEVRLRVPSQLVRRRTRHLTVGALLERWLKEDVPARCRPTTVELYRTIVRRHLLPAFGQEACARLEPGDVEAFLSQQVINGMKPSTVRLVRAVLRAAFSWGMRLGLISRNVVSGTRQFGQGSSEVRPLEAADARRLLEATAATDLGTICLLALMLGLRSGEIRGLAWEDVDFTSGHLHVRRSLQRVRGSLVLVPVKSDRSRRTLPMPHPVISALRKHRERQAARLDGSERPASGLAFTSRTGQPVDPRNLDRDLRRLLRSLGLQPFGLHRLRHSCAAYLISTGTDLRIVQEVLGHATIRLTADLYGHVLPRATASALDGLTRMLEGAMPETGAVTVAATTERIAS